MKFSVFQISRKGGRKINEDRMGYCYTSAAAVFVLADGMGGHPQGEVAAQLALESVAAQFQQEARPTLPDVATFLSDAVLAAQHKILYYGIDRGMADSPRTTLVLAVVQDGMLSWTHCGDSRLYVVRQGQLMTRTRDHSMLEQQRHKATEDGKPVTVNRNVLFTCLGSPARPIFSVSGPLRLLQGDRVMLCSDGLWSAVAQADIVRELTVNPVAVAVPDLVEQALRASGSASDNVTCLALTWETPDVVQPTRAVATTEDVNEEFFASTVQIGWADAQAEALELDDAAIERSIAEINDAIRRSGKKAS
ncbi:MAG: serine/threonine-protein phosphatase [Rhodoferax sp.]|nr:serine/threonine-protein phosphatase [Rhodoferax sp.]